MAAHFQVPSAKIVVCPVIGEAEFTVISRVSPAGPVPLNSGSWVFIFSFSFGLFIANGFWAFSGGVELNDDPEAKPDPSVCWPVCAVP